MIKRIESYTLWGFLVSLVLLMPACEWPWSKSKKEEPTATTSTVTGPKIIDVNEKKIYDDAHIKGAINIPYDKLESETANFDKNSLVVTYCTTYECTESHRAAKKLKELGFTNVRIYQGGMNDWYKHAQEDKAAYPYEGPATEPYLTKSVSKPEAKEEVPTITAEEISKQLEEARGK